MSAIIKVKNLSFVANGRTILSDISFEANAGKWLAVLGENGSGKTSLLDQLMGFRKPSNGNIEVMGEDPQKDPYELRQQVAYLSEKVDLPGDCSIKEFLRFNAHFYKKHDAELEQNLIKALGIGINNRIGNLSAGEIRRVQIAASLAYKPKIILIDEITAVLDIVGRRKLMRLLKQAANEGACIVFATNILEGLYGNADDVLLLSSGKVLESRSVSLTLHSGNDTEFCNLISDCLEKDVA
ncbi:MAG: ABC transporter ATP-binding protein [Bdellovibrionales bacterium]|nr:ABC transporter ATP-binding protein [Bdellovibrionales bacterium]